MNNRRFDFYLDKNSKKKNNVQKQQISCNEFHSLTYSKLNIEVCISKIFFFQNSLKVFFILYGICRQF